MAKKYRFNSMEEKAINRILKQIDCFVTVDIDLIYEIIKKYKVENKVFYGNMDFLVDDGFLYIDNIPMERVASKLPRQGMTDYSYYMEGKILARQGL